MAEPGTFDLKAEVKLSKCDSIPEIRDSLAIRGLEYSSSCNVLVEEGKPVSLSVQCKHEKLKYLVIKPIKVEKKSDDAPSEWTEVEKLPSRDDLSLEYKAEGMKLWCAITYAQAFYEGILTSLFGQNENECSLTLRLKETAHYKRALVQVVAAGNVHKPASTHCAPADEPQSNAYADNLNQTSYVTPNDSDSFIADD